MNCDRVRAVVDDCIVMVADHEQHVHDATPVGLYGLVALGAVVLVVDLFHRATAPTSRSSTLAHRPLHGGPHS